MRHMFEGAAKGRARFGWTTRFGPALPHPASVPPNSLRPGMLLPDFPRDGPEKRLDLRLNRRLAQNSAAPYWDKRRDSDGPDGQVRAKRGQMRPASRRMNHLGGLAGRFRDRVQNKTLGMPRRLSEGCDPDHDHVCVYRARVGQNPGSLSV